MHIACFFNFTTNFFGEKCNLFFISPPFCEYLCKAKNIRGSLASLIQIKIPFYIFQIALPPIEVLLKKIILKMGPVATILHKNAIIHFFIHSNICLIKHERKGFDSLFLTARRSCQS